jgi:hypothetical protein
VHVVGFDVMNRITREADDKSLLLNVAVIPPDDVTNEAISLSKETGPIGGLFELNHTTRFPHATIYMARFAPSKISATQEILSIIIPILEEQILEHIGYHLTPHKYYEVSYAKTPALERTQVIIAKQLRELRFAPGNPVIEHYFGAYEHAVEENVESWGYDLMGDLYRPHITLTRFPAESQIGSQTSLPKSSNNLSFPLARIGLFRADDMGSARELISEWKLR